MATPSVRYLVDEQGKRVSVVLDVEEYEELLEDLHDLAVVAERRDEGTITLEEMERRLQQDASP